MTQTEALKLALEALIGARAFLESDAPVEIWSLNDKAITAIKEALAQPKRDLKPRCFADFQPNHEHERKCQWCAVEIECKTGMAQPEQDSVSMADYMAIVEKYAFLKASQPEQEPVAKAVVSKRKTDEHHITDIDLTLTEAGKRLSSGEHCLYTTPPPVTESHKQSTPCGEPVVYKKARIHWLCQEWKEDHLSDINFVESIIAECLTPPPVPEVHKRKPLTDEQIDEIWDAVITPSNHIREFVRAIEASHGIRSDEL